MAVAANQLEGVRGSEANVSEPTAAEGEVGEIVAAVKTLRHEASAKVDKLFEETMAWMTRDLDLQLKQMQESQAQDLAKLEADLKQCKDRGSAAEAENKRLNSEQETLMASMMAISSIFAGVQSMPNAVGMSNPYAQSLPQFNASTPGPALGQAPWAPWLSQPSGETGASNAPRVGGSNGIASFANTHPAPAAPAVHAPPATDKWAQYLAELPESTKKSPSFQVDEQTQFPHVEQPQHGSTRDTVLKSALKEQTLDDTDGVTVKAKPLEPPGSPCQSRVRTDSDLMERRSSGGTPHKSPGGGTLIRPRTPMSAGTKSPGLNAASRQPWSLLASPTPQKSPGPLATLMSSPTLTPKESPGPLGRMGLKSPGSAFRSPFVIHEDGGSTFSFSLRRADGVSLGLEMAFGHTNDEEMKVTKISPGGAVAAWNKQCIGGPGAGKAVAIGDKITSVNGETKVQKMLQECREKKLLRLTVARKPSSAETSPVELDTNPLESPVQPSSEFLPKVEPQETFPNFHRQLSLQEQLPISAMDAMRPPQLPSADTYGALFECLSQDTTLPFAPPPGL